MTLPYERLSCTLQYNSRLTCVILPATHLPGFTKVSLTALAAVVDGAGAAPEVARDGRGAHEHRCHV